MKNKFLLLFIIFFACIAFSCKSTQQEETPVETTPVEQPVEVEPVEKKVEPPPVEKKPEPVKEKEEVPPPPPAVDEEYERSVQAIEGEKVSVETFNADKAAILKKIEELNEIMKKSDFDSWCGYIDADSKDYWSKTANLKEYSKKLPKNASRQLNNLKDYFNYVFIPSRKGRRIDEIRYISATSVKAVQVRKSGNDTELVIYYNFVKEKGDWKVYLPRL